VAASVAVAADAWALSEYTVAVRAANRGYRCTPVSVVLANPEPPGSWKGVTVRDPAAEVTVPCSALAMPDNRTEVTWLVRDLAQGASRAYRVAFVKEAPEAAAVTLGEPANGAVEIRIGDALFTRYVYEGAPKPYCYPIIGPTGVAVTRSFPMEKVEGESQDHPHQRSLWFTHGEVNGIDFWAESDKTGRQVHRGFEALDSGSVCGRLRARNDWMSADGKKVCEDVRELRVYGIPDVCLFDFAITIRATDGPVEFGDTKEGTFGIRVASPMDVTPAHPEAHITNSEGQRDGEAWGKPAAWCDYSAPINGTMVGISVFDHPTSFRHPTYWHVRTYGLFAANPFGLRHFVGDTTGKGRFTLQPGEEATFRYRILIHPGDADTAKVADWYGEYADPPTVAVE
jgi:hypothetical protein